MKTAQWTCAFWCVIVLMLNSLEQNSLQVQAFNVESKHYTSLPLGLVSGLFVSRDIWRIKSVDQNKVFRGETPHQMGSLARLTHNNLNHRTLTDDGWTCLRFYELHAFHNPLLAFFFFYIYLIFCQNKLFGLCFLGSPSLSKQSQTHCHKHIIMIRHCFVQCPVKVSSLPAHAMVIFTVWRHRPFLHTWE